MVGVITPIGILQRPKEKTCPLESTVIKEIGDVLAIEDNARGTGKGMKNPIKSPKTEIRLPTDHVWRYPSLEHVGPHRVAEIW